MEKISHKSLYRSCEEHEKKFFVPTCTLAPGNARREQIRGSLAYSLLLTP